MHVFTCMYIYIYTLSKVIQIILIQRDPPQKNYLTDRKCYFPCEVAIPTIYVEEMQNSTYHYYIINKLPNYVQYTFNIKSKSVFSSF